MLSMGEAIQGHLFVGAVERCSRKTSGDKKTCCFTSWTSYFVLMREVTKSLK